LCSPSALDWIVMDNLSLNILNGASGHENSAMDLSAPVFVLCMGRTGSTLLRFLLDAHPDLACPPETSLPMLCGQLAVVWSLIEGAPLSQQRGDTPRPEAQANETPRPEAQANETPRPEAQANETLPGVPAAAIAGIRKTMDMMIRPYLVRRGGKRFCDKSLCTARFADLLLRVFPDATFLCLFRHPMDMIRSALDACPWGLTGYGFDTYIAGSPGNAVMALARYWLDEASAIAAVADKYPQSCYRLRYEDMVSDPEDVAAKVFDFIGVPRVPGISEKCFTSEHERFGPADHKIWRTSKITSASIGEGESIPVGLIPPPLMQEINKLATQIGYAEIDGEWGTPGSTGGTSGTGGGTSGIPASRLLADRLAAGLAEVDGAVAARWAASAPGAFMLVMRARPGGYEAQWSVNVTEAGLDLVAGLEDPDWSIIGSPRAWDAVLSGDVNLATALRRCDLRYCDQGENDLVVGDARISMMAVLLGLPSPVPDRHTAPGVMPVPS
jgi:hypothetical protein